MFPSSGEGRETPTAVISKGPYAYMRMELDPVSKKLCFLVFRILDGKKSRDPVILKKMDNVQNCDSYITIPLSQVFHICIPEQ
jgi:hypothetical protein